MIISTAYSFDSLVFTVLKQGKNKWLVMVNQHNLKAVVISIKSPTPNIIEITNCIHQ